MKTPDKVQKINYAYLLGYIFIPLAIAALSCVMGFLFFRDGGTGAVVCFMALPMIAIFWWILAGRYIYRLGKKKMVRQLKKAGIDCRQIFYSNSCVVSIDTAQGKIGMIFFWNPLTVQVVPVSRVSRAWTDDGASGAGITRGTGRVSFLFEVDGIKVRVNTFISNQRWKLTDQRVLEGISKADMWVQALDRARQQGAGV